MWPSYQLTNSRITCCFEIKARIVTKKRIVAVATKVSFKVIVFTHTGGFKDCWIVF